ncbi:MAG TPA: hypothetical protein DCE42_12865, partial [Myxococcales bacterium]|nr:hypothetical protein [Myxococcales bacterium]
MNAGIQTSTSNCAKTIIDVQQTHRSPSLHERWHSNIDDQLRFVNAGIQTSTINCAKSIVYVQQTRGLPSLHERWHSN